MTRDIRPRQILFDPTAEIFATDSSGSFFYPLAERAATFFDTVDFDEVRVVVSLWSPSANAFIDLDRAYVELRGCFDPEEELHGGERRFTLAEEDACRRSRALAGRQRA